MLYSSVRDIKKQTKERKGSADIKELGMGKRMQAKEDIATIMKDELWDKVIVVKKLS